MFLKRSQAIYDDNGDETNPELSNLKIGILNIIVSFILCTFKDFANIRLISKKFNHSVTIVSKKLYVVNSNIHFYFQNKTFDSIHFIKKELTLSNYKDYINIFQITIE